MKKRLPSSTEIFAERLRLATSLPYLFRLYIGGTKPNSIRALQTIKAICDELLPGRYQLEVVDVFQEPQKAAALQILALPTLILVQPPPTRRFVGDLTERDVLIRRLLLDPRSKS